jgi:hypothetical protein
VECLAWAPAEGHNLLADKCSRQQLGSNSQLSLRFLLFGVYSKRIHPMLCLLDDSAADIGAAGL